MKSILGYTWALAILFHTGLAIAEKPPIDGAPAIAQATAAVEAARAKAEADPTRPVYHFRPPAQWMNDPNGPIFHDGYYHMFYQHNPYDDMWNHMHWGHARSKNLVDWEMMPIALWPSKERGEQHCFSGCMTIAPNGDPTILYTSIGHDLPEQWAARPKDATWTTWEKHPASPVLTEGLHGDTKIYEWRDPYVFKHAGATRLVLGGNLNQSHGGKAVVTAYTALNDSLTEWRYNGVLFTHPDADAKNIECPNFFPLGDRWTLIVSPHRAVEYFTGDLAEDGNTFAWKQRGIVDHGDYYAPNGCFDPQGRHILWGWVRGFKNGLGWNGCLSLPRIVTLDKDGSLLQQPAPELEALRGAKQSFPNTSLEAKTEALAGLTGDTLELRAQLAPAKGAKAALLLRVSEDATRSVVIETDGTKLWVAGQEVALPKRDASAPVALHVFLDKSVLEVYAEGGATVITKVIDAPVEDRVVALRAEGGAANFQALEAWPLRAIW